MNDHLRAIVKSLNDLPKEDRIAIMNEVSAGTYSSAMNASSKDRVSLSERIAACATHPDTAPSYSFAQGTLRRIGFDMHASADASTGMIDMFRLDAALKSASLSIENRIALKSALHRCGLLPA